MRTSTSHAAFIHLFFRIHVLLQLELPDVKPPAMVAGEDSSRKLVWTWHSPGGFSTGHSIFQSRALLVVWRFLGEGDLTCGVTAHTHTGLRGCKVSSQGKWKMEPLGYSDTLHYEWVWKGSNADWEVKAAGMNMSHLHEKACYNPSELFMYIYILIKGNSPTARLAALNFVRGVIFNFLLCWSEGMYFTIRSLFCLILTKSGTFLHFTIWVSVPILRVWYLFINRKTFLLLFTVKSLFSQLIQTQPHFTFLFT